MHVWAGRDIPEIISIMCDCPIQQLVIPVAELLNTLCEECNINSHNFEEAILTYSTSGRSAYLTSDLVYSNSDGTITSSILISMMWSWLQSQEMPTLNVAGQSVALSKKCSTPANTFTSEICMDQLSDQTATCTFTSAVVSITFIAGGFTGAIAATMLLLLLLFWYVYS